MDDREKGEYVLAVFRILIGWLMLWAFFDKMFGLGYQTPGGSGYIDGVSPSSFVSFVTSGAFSGFYNSVAGNGLVDVILLLGCLILGVTLILGFASKLTSVAATAFFLIMYSLVIPPTDNPLIDYRVVLAVGLWAIYFLGGYDRLSVNGWWKGLPIVKRFPILQ